jgi:hypothetical protein
MAAIRVRQSRRWATCRKPIATTRQRKSEDLLLIILRMKYGGHFLKKFPSTSGERP